MDEIYNTFLIPQMFAEVAQDKSTPCRGGLGLREDRRRASTGSGGTGARVTLDSDLVGPRCSVMTRHPRGRMPCRANPLKEAASRPRPSVVDVAVHAAPARPGGRIASWPRSRRTPSSAQQIVEDAKEHVLYSWSVQDAINPIAVAGAEGRYFWDYDGKRYLDFASQLVNVSIGHRHPKVVAAIKEQAEKLATIGPPMATESRSRLGQAARRGHARRPDDVVLHERRRRGERERDQARALVHGPAQDHRALPLATTARPAGAITLTGDPRRWPAEPGIPGVVRMLDPYTYRCPAGHPDPCPVCTGAPHLEEILQYEGAHTVAAVILETVTGTNGIIVPPDGYLQSIREVCDRHGILLICDEVMAGFGRTGKWFAVRQLGRRPRHPHASRRGSTPATCRSARWSSPSRSPTGCATSFFAGGLTYSGHPLACASAVASIEAFQEEGIVENAAAHGRRLPRRARARWRRSTRRSATCAASAASGASSSSRTARRASRSSPSTRAARRRRRSARLAKRGARARPLPDDALERRHDLPAADDHARGARRGPRDPRRRARDRRRVRQLQAGRSRRRRREALPSSSESCATSSSSSRSLKSSLQPLRVVGADALDVLDAFLRQARPGDAGVVGLQLTFSTRPPPGDRRAAASRRTASASAASTRSTRRSRLSSARLRCSSASKSLNVSPRGSATSASSSRRSTV